MSGVAEFLLARLDDQQREIDQIPDWYCTDSARGEGWGSRGECPICDKYMFDGTEAATEDGYWEHFEDAHQRTRVLADVAAKRRIVEAGRSECMSHGVTREDHCDGCQSAASVNAEMDWVVRTLATAYSSHPDYDKEWQS